MKMVSAALASRSEEEDRELVPRRRGPAALDLRLLRRRHVALVDASFEVEALDAVRRRPHEARRGALRRRRRLGEAEAVERGLAFELLDPKKDAGLDRAERLEVRIVGLGGRVDGPRRLLGEFLSFVEVHEALDRRGRGTAVADHAQGALVGERAERGAGRDLIKVRRPGAVRVAADRRALHVDDLRRAVEKCCKKL